MRESGDDTPRSQSEWAKAVLSLFDRELAGNGQEWHIDEIKGDITERYGQGYETAVEEAVMWLLKEGRIFERSPCIYKRVL